MGSIYNSSVFLETNLGVRSRKIGTSLAVSIAVDNGAFKRLFGMQSEGISVWLILNEGSSFIFYLVISLVTYLKGNNGLCVFSGF